MGGKGYKPYTSLTGKKVSGDWEDSDRGAGNKAKKRAGGKVEKKSPTYQAYVLNKEHHQKDAEGKVIEHGDGTPSSVEEQELKEYSPNVTYQAKGGKKSGKLGKSSVYSLKDKGESKKEFRKSQVKDIKGGYLKTEDFIGEVIDKTVNSNTKKIDVMKGKNKVKINPNVGEQIEKPGNSGDTPNANVVDPALGRKERRISMMKRQILRKKQQAVMQGAGADIVASHDPLSIRDTISSILELNRYEKETGKSSGSMNMPKGKPTQKGGTSSPVMRAVRTSVRRETGKPTGQTPKTKGEKGRRQPGDRKTTPADTIAKRRQSKADAERLMRDTSGT